MNDILNTMFSLLFIVALLLNIWNFYLHYTQMWRSTWVCLSHDLPTTFSWRLECAILQDAQLTETTVETVHRSLFFLSLSNKITFRSPLWVAFTTQPSQPTVFVSKSSFRTSVFCSNSPYSRINELNQITSVSLGAGKAVSHSFHPEASSGSDILMVTCFHFIISFYECTPIVIWQTFCSFIGFQSNLNFKSTNVLKKTEAFTQCWGHSFIPGCFCLF